MTLPLFELPPGPSYILRQLFSLKVAGYAASVGCVHVVGEIVGMDLPVWAIILFPVVALPGILYAQTELQYWKDKRKAKSLGARLAPKVPSKWPAGIDLITALDNVFKTGYLGKSDDLAYRVWGSHGTMPGDTMVDWLAEGGQTVDMRSLWASRVSLLTTARLTTLITIVDRDDGATVH